eukprot:248978_1
MMQSYRIVVRYLESSILKFTAVGWTPSSGFDDNKRLMFDIKTDLNRIPTRKYHFTHLEDAVFPLFFYLLLLIFGHLSFWVNKKQNNRKPLISNSVLFYFKFLYNIGQIFLCGYMFLESLILVYRNNYHFMPWTKSRCDKFDFSAPVVGKLLWLFYVSKIYDFFDTLFIILSNKRNQFSILHQYHHITIYMINWLNINLNYDSDSFFYITLNAFVHTVMYLYYLISMHVPKVIDSKTKRNKYGIWWKKYLTTIQMIQFLLMNVQAILLLFNGCAENPPRLVMMYLTYIMSLFIMFLNFFIKSYGVQQKNKKI